MYYSNKQSLTEDVLCPVNNCHKSIQPELINVVTTQQGGGGWREMRGWVGWPYRKMFPTAIKKTINCLHNHGGSAYYR